MWRWKNIKAIKEKINLKQKIMKAQKELKTLVINGKPIAAGKPESLMRYVRKIMRKRNDNPEISLIKGIIFELEKAV